MYELKFRPKAYKSMQALVLSYPHEIEAIDAAFVELQASWVLSPQVKNIGRIKGLAIRRKRVWRRRIVFIEKEAVIEIFIIEIEKSTIKDYARWLAYVRKSLD